MDKRPTLPEEGYVRLKDVLKVIPVSRSTWYAGILENRYPAPTKLSARCSAWKVEDIRELLEKLSS